MDDRRRSLPAVGTLLDSAAVRELLARAPRGLVTDAVRRAIARVRDSEAVPPSDEAWGELVGRELEALDTPSLRPVLNATGVVLHTNLGRAPLARAAIDAIARVAAGSTNLEYDLEKGARGSRYVHCVELLRELTGAEDAIVVNNCAAALVLALNTFARGKEAIVSRGELIEIGGSFRVPEIMATGGATLREVGTTNRTSVDDYRRALGAATGVLVKVHRSNFEVRGFVAEASLRELAVVAQEAAVPLLYDFGSGLVSSLESYGLGGEPTARDGVREGATLVLMSGDKLLGGPQAGIIVGASSAIAACARNPLARALRVDKLTLSALEATLALHREPERAVREIPALAMLTMGADAIRARAETVCAALLAQGIGAAVVETEATVGGGAYPTARIPSWAVAIAADAVKSEALLRGAPVPVIGRIEHDRLLLDLRSIPAAKDDELTRIVVDALAPISQVAERAASRDSSGSALPIAR